MASVCPNAASAEANYAGPMPIIGLYIAAATAVCFLLILLDVVSAIRQRKPWIPVRFFSLNSFTLTVMGVSTKLLVDLTTYMPGLDAQLSKLCSSVFICISMGLFMPSLGTMKGSDRYANLTSLTIVVVTIIVNVCMQISSGVIFSFVAEHIVILVFMFILLWSCWSSSLDIEGVLVDSAFDLKEILKESILVNGKIDRLESYYQRSYICNPQVLMCQYSHCITIGLLSSLSFTILLQAILRATVLKEFQICMEYSDYKWSIWVVVAAQFLTCALACLSITCRWISMAFHMERNKFSMKIRGDDFSKWKIAKILTSDWDIHLMALNHLGSGAFKCFVFLQSLLLYLRFGTEVLLNFIDELVLFVIYILRRSLIFYNKELRKWLVKKSEEDLKRWKEKKESNVVSELCPSMFPCPSYDLLEKMDEEEMNICGLPVKVLLCAKEVLPRNMVDSLLKVMWMTRDIDSGVFHKEFVEPALKKFPAIPTDEESQPSEFQRTLNIFEEMLKLLDDEYNKIIDEEILQRARELNTIDGLYDVIKQFVLSIMHFYLSSFSTTIYQYIMDSPVDKIEAHIKFAVKLSSKLEGLEDKVSWLPMRPQGNIIGVNVVTSSEVSAEVLMKDEMGGDVAELSEVLVETATTEAIT